MKYISEVKLRGSAEILIILSSILIFPKDYFISTIGLHTELIGILILVFLLCKNWFDGRLNPNYPKFLGVVFVLIISSWIGSVFFNTILQSKLSINTSSYYASFFLALIIWKMAPQRLEKFMFLMMLFNVGLQLMEAATGEFVYAYVDDDYVYDEKMLSTDDGALRVKGLWGSPLNAIGITMSLAFMKPNSPIIWLVVCIASALGQGRLGLGIGLVGLLLTVFSIENKSNGVSKIKYLFLAMAGCFLIAGVIFLFGTDASMQRFLEAGSSDNSQNISRLLFWGMSINEILNYNFIEHLFGKFGYIKALQGGTESDWLRIWLDNGLICLFAYILLVLYRLYKSIIKRDVMQLYAVVATLFVMAVYPHAQSMPNGILVWLFLFGGWPNYKTVAK